MPFSRNFPTKVTKRQFKCSLVSLPILMQRFSNFRVAMKKWLFWTLDNSKEQYFRPRRQANFNTIIWIFLMNGFLKTHLSLKNYLFDTISKPTFFIQDFWNFVFPFDSPLPHLCPRIFPSKWRISAFIDKVTIFNAKNSENSYFSRIWHLETVLLENLKTNIFGPKTTIFNNDRQFGHF